MNLKERLESAVAEILAQVACIKDGGGRYEPVYWGQDHEVGTVKEIHADCMKILEEHGIVCGDCGGAVLYETNACGCGAAAILDETTEGEKHLLDEIARLGDMRFIPDLSPTVQYAYAAQDVKE